MATNLIKTSFTLVISLFLAPLHVSAMDTDEGIPEGIYRIKNESLSCNGDPDNPHIGLLACAIQEVSPGVYGAEILDERAEKNHYLFKEKHRDSLLWHIRRVEGEDGVYTIRNCAHEDGFLTWFPEEKSLSGYYSYISSHNQREAHEAGQHVKEVVGSYLPYGKPLVVGAGWVGHCVFGTATLTEGFLKTTGGARYLKGAQEGQGTGCSPNLLWKIHKAENEKYILQNGGGDFYRPDLGILSCANTLFPAGKRVQILHNFEDSAYNGVYRTSHGIGGALRSAVLWELSWEMIAEGFYTITNGFLRSEGDPTMGRLSCSKITSTSGYYVEVLKEKGPEGNLEGADVWEVRKALDEGGLYYTIRNCAWSEGGWLSWTYNRISKRYYLQILADNKQYVYNKYPGGKAQYDPGGIYRKDVLWKITQGKDGKYIFKNMGSSFSQLDSGILGYTDEVCAIGPYAQLLDNASESGGDSIMWELALEKEKESA